MVRIWPLLAVVGIAPRFWNLNLKSRLSTVCCHLDKIILWKEYDHLSPSVLRDALYDISIIVFLNLCRCQLMVHGCEQTRCILQKTAPHQTVHWRMGKTWRSQKVQENWTPQNTLHSLASHHDNKQTPSKGCFFTAACYQRFEFIGLTKKKNPSLRVFMKVLVKMLQLNCGNKWNRISPPTPFLLKGLF